MVQGQATAALLGTMTLVAVGSHHRSYITAVHLHSDGTRTAAAVAAAGLKLWRVGDGGVEADV